MISEGNPLKSTDFYAIRLPELRSMSNAPFANPTVASIVDEVKRQMAKDPNLATDLNCPLPEVLRALASDFRRVPGSPHYPKGIRRVEEYLKLGATTKLDALELLATRSIPDARALEIIEEMREAKKTWSQRRIWILEVAEAAYLPLAPTAGSEGKSPI